ncbi:hypothetical protein RJ641_029200 [Dillenia turbinata]|uniref:Uncharacterized protein n=1 Tax=Dillenia turbinata TaxID=194707 RepID=A0AAN8VT83_9MAGN
MEAIHLLNLALLILFCLYPQNSDPKKGKVTKFSSKSTFSPSNRSSSSLGRTGSSGTNQNFSNIWLYFTSPIWGSQHHPRMHARKYLSYVHTTMGMASGELWHNLRCLTSSEIFSINCIAKFSGIRLEEVELQLKQLFQTSSKKQAKVVLKSKFFELSFNVIMRMIVGKRYYGENGEDMEDAKTFQDRMQELLVLHGSKFGRLLASGKDFQGVVKKMKLLMGKMDPFYQRLIDE